MFLKKKKKKKKKDKYIDEGTETDPSKYSWLIFDRRVQFNGERTVFSTNGEGTTGHAHAKGKKKRDTYPTPFTNVNSNGSKT